MKDIVIFDLDGTLADGTHAYTCCRKITTTKHGLEAL